jgi:hypothetical protein
MTFDPLRYPRVALGLTIALTSSASYAVFCPPQYQEQFVSPMFTSATTALNQAISAVDAALSSEMEMYNQRLTSAVAILTKQKAAAANQIADASKNAAQTTATALNTMAQAERVKDARFTYGGEFGQGYNPCVVYSGRNLLANRDAEIGEERRARVMSEIVAAPGRYVDPLQARTEMAREHRDFFCTPAQAASGMCTQVGTLAGASLTAATLFDPMMETDPAYRAKVAFVNNVAGMPDAPVPQQAANTPAATTYALAKAQKDALVSPALASFKEVQMDYTGMNLPHGGSDIPLATRLDKEVKRYLGDSADYMAWTKVMAAQNSRGLMVEMLKVKALDLLLLEKQYRQYERMEANLATLVAGELRGNMERTRSAAEKATRQQVTSQIR